MRTIRTFILRLLMDTNEPRALRGTVRVVADDEEHAFTDGQSLLTLLRRLSRAAEQPLPASPKDSTAQKGETRK